MSKTHFSKNVPMAKTNVTRANSLNKLGNAYISNHVCQVIKIILAFLYKLFRCFPILTCISVIFKNACVIESRVIQHILLGLLTLRAASNVIQHPRLVTILYPINFAKLYRNHFSGSSEEDFQMSYKHPIITASKYII